MNPDNDKVVVYQDAAGEWRWRRQDVDNAKIVSESGEGYISRAIALSAAHTLNPDIPIEVIRD